jgi:hypothetical protein
VSDKTIKAAASVESQPAVRASEGSFTREQFLASAKYSHQDKDVLTALLDPDALYTAAEAQQVIEEFKNKEAI